MTQVKVGLVGLGTMGSGMVKSLLKAGYSVTGYNRTQARMAPLTGLGMHAATTPGQAVADEAFVIVAVSDDAALREVTRGENGLITHLRPGSVLILCGTHSLEATSALGVDVRSKGADFLDAPMTGSKLGAENAGLTFMVGGPLAVLQRAQPLFAAMGKHVVHVGEAPGLGQSAKYCLNLSQAITLEGMLESWGLALRLGVPLSKISECFQKSAASSGVGTFKASYLAREDYEPHFRLDLMHKDLHLALSQAAARKMPLLAASSVIHLYDQAAIEGLGNRDFLATAILLARWLSVSWSGHD